MKLDATDLRYLTAEDFRVLTAVEMGSKNHEVVPSPLIAQISGLRSGGVNKLLASLAKRNLISRVQNSKYDGYRLTYGGYDYLAMRALSKRDSMQSVGNQIGVGKESDVYVAADADGNQMVLKLHRLGRISFRSIKNKRDYMGKRKSASWMYMSRLAAQKEWAFMKVLYEHDFPVPKPIDQARHCILMELIDAFPLRQVSEVASPGRLYSALMDLIVRFARSGLIHGDFNEFNILIRRDSGEPVVIDFPQMVSTSHENAEWYFNRDVDCVRTFFRRRFRYESVLYPKFSSTISAGELQEDEGFRLDIMVSASGFGNKDMETLQAYIDTLKLHEHSSESPDYEIDESEAGGDEGQNQEHGRDKDIDDKDEENSYEESDEEESLHNDGTGDSHERPDICSQSHEAHHTTADETSSSLRPSPDVVQYPPLSNDDHVPIRPPITQDQIKMKVFSDLSRLRAKQHSKYNSKRSTQRVGRLGGSKAKQDPRVELSKNGVWE